jgi:hypothetical protein
MTLRTRRVLFYGLVALFLILGTGIVFYAQGWRFDFGTFKTSKIGGIYVESFPANAAITLDGKPAQNTSGFLSRGTLISDLFPENYSLSLKAAGYDPWTESVMVSPTLVTELKYAVLIPQNATSVSPSAHLVGFMEGGGNIVTMNASGTIAIPRPGAGGAAATSSAVIARGTLAGADADVATILIQTPSDAWFAYGTAAAASGAGMDVSAILAKSSVAAKSITAVTLDPYDGRTVFAQTPSQLFAADVPAGTAAILATAPAGRELERPLGISSSWLAWAEYQDASGTSRIFIYDPSSGNIIDSSLSLPGHVTSLGWIRSTVLGVLGEDGELYRYDISSEALTKVADDVKSFYATPDGSTLAALESRSVEVFSLTAPNGPGGYYRFNLPSITSVQSLAWYKDDTHLFVVYPDHVSFLDLADFALQNYTTVSAIEAGTDPVYDAQENSLYLIDGGGRLVRFDFPGS